MEEEEEEEGGGGGGGGGDGGDFIGLLNGQHLSVSKSSSNGSSS